MHFIGLCKVQGLLDMSTIFHVCAYAVQTCFWNTLELEFPDTDWHVCFLYGSSIPLPKVSVSLIFSLTENTMYPANGCWFKATTW